MGAYGGPWPCWQQRQRAGGLGRAAWRQLTWAETTWRVVVEGSRQGQADWWLSTLELELPMLGSAGRQNPQQPSSQHHRFSPISTPSSCPPRCVARVSPPPVPSPIGANWPAAVKMSFIQKRALSTLIPPKVRFRPFNAIAQTPRR